MNNQLKELSYDKIKIRHNENPIPMEKFLSYLLVHVERVRRPFLGSDTGWTRHSDTGSPYSGELIICGGIVPVRKKGEWQNIELLDSIKYKENLQNPYNNFVNPLYLWDILNSKGRVFFLDYYSDKVNEINITLDEKAKSASKARDDFETFFSSLKDSINKGA